MSRILSAFFVIFKFISPPFTPPYTVFLLLLTLPPPTSLPHHSPRAVFLHYMSYLKKKKKQNNNSKYLVQCPFLKKHSGLMIFKEKVITQISAEKCVPFMLSRQYQIPSNEQNCQYHFALPDLTRWLLVII